MLIKYPGFWCGIYHERYQVHCFDEAAYGIDRHEHHTVCLEEGIVERQHGAKQCH